MHSLSRRAAAYAMAIALSQPPLPRSALAADGSIVASVLSSSRGSRLEYAMRPKVRSLPRRMINQQFAVQCMRTSYRIADELDYVAMDEFQKSQFLFRQTEWDLYRNEVQVQQGELTDPNYFDFISFVQYASIADTMRRGKIIFEELQDAEGTAVLVRRDPKLPASNADLPAAHAERVGNALLDWLGETYPGITPKPPTAGGVTRASLLEDVRQFAALLEIVDFCLSARAEPHSSGGIELILVAPATIWSSQVLRLRGDLANDFEAKIVKAYLARCGVPCTYTTEVRKGTELRHVFSWPERFVI